MNSSYLRQELIVSGMSAEYMSVYGVSNLHHTGDEELAAGKIYRISRDRIAIFAFIGKSSQVVSTLKPRTVLTVAFDATHA